MSKLTEATLLPLSLVIVFLGGVSWLTSIDNKASANAKDNYSIAQSQEKVRDDVTILKTDVATVKAIVSEMSNRQNRMAEYLRSKLK